MSEHPGEPRRPSDDELERLLRASLHSHADQRPDPDALSDRVLARLAQGEQPAAASRRRWRVGGPLTAAASVAAVVAAALVGTGVVKHVHDQHLAAASSRSAAVVAPPSPTPSTASPDMTPDRPTTATPSATPDPPVPDGFRVRDLSFQAGGNDTYAMGKVCPNDQCAGAAIAYSSNGRDFVTLSRPQFSVGSDTGDVQSLRFASASIGYAYGPTSLYRTSDGGRSWDSMSAGGAVAIEAYNGVAARLTASSTDCTAGCRYAVSTSEVQSDSWQTQALPAAASGTEAFLARTKDDVYVAVANGSTTTLFYSADDGNSWNRQSSALCAGDFGGSTKASLVSLTSAQDGSVVGLCANSSSASVQVSVDHGTSFTMPAHNVPGLVGTVSSLTVAAFSGRNILVSSDQLYLSTDGGQTFKQVAFDKSPVNPARIVFLGTESETTARWVCGNGSTIWTSDSAGISGSWQNLDFK